MSSYTLDSIFILVCFLLCNGFVYDLFDLESVGFSDAANQLFKFKIFN